MQRVRNYTKTINFTPEQGARTFMNRTEQVNYIAVILTLEGAQL